jgi:hypothetical protein
MAGKGKKTFVAGEVLLAQDVNDYLMDQSVMNFASSAARSSAIPTPTEGMFSVTTDNDQVDYYDGSAWVPALPVGAWQSWAPTLGGGWANGNGTWNAQYTQIGKTVHVRGIFTMGTSRPGTLSGMTCSLPVAPAGGGQGFSTNRANGVSGQFMFQAIEGSTLSIYAINAASTYLTRTGVTATVPAAWTTSDFIQFSFTYEAA